jgi:hypothetical protein
MIKSKRLRWEGHEARMGRKRFRWQGQKERDHLEDPDVGRIILKSNSEEQD